MRYVYMLRCADNTIYTWITNNIDKRIYDHNNSSCWARYTKSRRPVNLVRLEELNNRSEASKRELIVKKLTRKNKEDLINNKEINNQVSGTNN